MQKVQVKEMIERQDIVPENSDNTIGTLHWWTVQELSADMDDAKRKWIDAGLDKKDFRFKTGPSAMLSKAARRIKKPSNLRIEEKIKDEFNPNLYILSIYETQGDNSSKLVNAVNHGTVELDEKTGLVAIKSNHEIAEKLMNKYNNAKNVIDEDDVRNLLIKAFDWANAITVRRTGGIYFISKNMTSSLESICNFFGVIDQVKLYIFPVIGTAKNKRDIGDDLKDEISYEIRSILDEMDSDKQMTPRIISSRIERLSELKKKVGIFTDFIDIQKENVLQNLTDAEGRLSRYLLGS